MTYNTTALQAATTIPKLIVFANDVTRGTFSGFLILAVFFISLISFMGRNDLDVSVAGSCFVCFVLSLVMGFGSMIGFEIVTVFGLGVAFSGFYLYVIKRQ